MGDIRCRISRSNRPCLVCPGTMDLIEASPRFSLFNALPLCGTGSVDCLDCPTCGFSTTTADYQYLDMCKKQRLGMFYCTTSRGGKDLPTGESSKKKKPHFECECSSCQVQLSTGWQFCPHCGRRTGLAIAADSDDCSPHGNISQFNSHDSTASKTRRIVRSFTLPNRQSPKNTSSHTNISRIPSIVL